jgi:membrane fusion protein (multidrug efflux system)
MAKKFVFMLLVVAALLGGLGFVKYRQVEAAMAKGASFTPPPTAVTTVSVKPEQWPSTTSVIGTLEAVQGVIVAADLPGTVSRINFESGQYVQKGDVLVELDTRQERAQLASLQAQWDLAKANWDRNDGLLKAGVISRADFDASTAQQRQTTANVAEVKATIERKTITAPFSGTLGIRKVNLGQYLASGNPIVELQALSPIYVNFGVPQQDGVKVRVGGSVRVTSDELGGRSLTGRVNALNAVVDETTRNIQIQAIFTNADFKLKPGMFVQVEYGTGSPRQVIPLPASAINYAPYGDSVYVVTDLKDPKGQTYRGVRQQFVKIEGSRGDQVAVVSGLKPGDEVVSSGVFKLRNGASVVINNQVQPENNPAPKPQDT